MEVRRALPRILVVPAALAGLFFLVPLVGLALRVPWSRVLSELARAEVFEAPSLRGCSGLRRWRAGIALGALGWTGAVGLFSLSTPPFVTAIAATFAATQARGGET